MWDSVENAPGYLALIGLLDQMFGSAVADLLRSPRWPSEAEDAAGECAVNLLVNIDVDDLDAAVAFYGDALGLQTGRRFGNAGVEMLGAAAPIYLLRKDSGTSATETTTQTRSYRRHWTPVHLDFVVTDIEEAVARAISAGATLESPVSTRSWGRLALLADPFGHGFCLVQFLGRGYDEIAE